MNLSFNPNTLTFAPADEVEEQWKKLELRIKQVTLKMNAIKSSLENHDNQNGLMFCLALKQRCISYKLKHQNTLFDILIDVQIAKDSGDTNTFLARLRIVLSPFPIV